jgi:hypothetical protein
MLKINYPPPWLMIWRPTSRLLWEALAAVANVSSSSDSDAHWQAPAMRSTGCSCAVANVSSSSESDAHWQAPAVRSTGCSCKCFVFKWIRRPLASSCSEKQWLQLQMFRLQVNQMHIGKLLLWYQTALYVNTDNSIWTEFLFRGCRHGAVAVSPLIRWVKLKPRLLDNWPTP